MHSRVSCSDTNNVYVLLARIAKGGQSNNVKSSSLKPIKFTNYSDLNLY